MKFKWGFYRFWRVILADKEKGHLILYAGMKIPGEAWLEFKVDPKMKVCFNSKATFRPKGILGRLYWYVLLPFHFLFFAKWQMRWLESLNDIKELDRSFVGLNDCFSFDQSGFRRHCPDPLHSVNLKGTYGIITGAGSGIGLAASKELIRQGMDCQLIGRDLRKLENHFKVDDSHLRGQCHLLDMGNLKSIVFCGK